MAHIKQILHNLTKLEREQLKYAHQYDISQYIRLPEDRFIGVHCKGVRHLIIEQEYNDWCVGRIVYE